MSRRFVVYDRKLGAVLLVLGVGAAAVASVTAMNASEEQGKPLERTVHENPQDLLTYWTPDRIREAKQNGL